MNSWKWDQHSLNILICVQYFSEISCKERGEALCPAHEWLELWGPFWTMRMTSTFQESWNRNLEVRDGPSVASWSCGVCLDGLFPVFCSVKTQCTTVRNFYGRDGDCWLAQYCWVRSDQLQWMNRGLEQSQLASSAKCLTQVTERLKDYFYP